MTLVNRKIDAYQSGGTIVLSIIEHFIIFTEKYNTMSETESTLLKTEIARLNKTIEALLIYNEELRLRISASRLKETPENFITSIHQKMDGSNETINSINQIEDGTNETINSINKTMDGTNKTINSINKTMDGTNESINSIHQTMDGINELQQALPHFIEAGSPLVSRVRNYMKQTWFKRSTHDGLRHSSIILLHIYNKSHCSSVELRKITGLSKGGLAKRMMALKKQGFIIRTGKQKFALTEKGMELFTGAVKAFASSA